MYDFLEIAQKNPVIPVVKLEDASDAPGLARALYQGGIHCMEITFRTEAAAEAIRQVAREVPEMLVGAGTVINEAQAVQAVEAGAEFIVSPGFSEQVAACCREKQVPCLPGCVTPTEIMLAKAAGLTLVKFFPAQANGGAQAVKALSAPFPDVRFIPTGGINLSNIGEYLALPCVCACGGSWMVPQEALARRNFREIRELAEMTAGELRRRYGR